MGACVHAQSAGTATEAVAFRSELAGVTHPAEQFTLVLVGVGRVQHLVAQVYGEFPIHIRLPHPLWALLLWSTSIRLQWLLLIVGWLALKMAHSHNQSESGDFSMRGLTALEALLVEFQSCGHAFLGGVHRFGAFGALGDFNWYERHLRFFFSFLSANVNGTYSWQSIPPDTSKWKKKYASKKKTTNKTKKRRKKRSNRNPGSGFGEWNSKTGLTMAPNDGLSATLKTTARVAWSELHPRWCRMTMSPFSMQVKTPLLNSELPQPSDVNIYSGSLHFSFHCVVLLTFFHDNRCLPPLGFWLSFVFLLLFFFWFFLLDDSIFRFLHEKPNNKNVGYTTRK